MKRKNLNLLLFAVPMSTLAACGSSGDGGTPPAPPPTVVAQEDTFGTTFGTAFRTDANGTAIEPKDGDIIPLSLTAEPVDVK
jgi:predicted small lipoprotein YifL